MARAKYLEKFSMPEISREAIDNHKGKKIYIETARLIAESIVTNADNYDGLSADLQELYKVTFGDSAAIEKFGTGVIQTPAAFFDSRISLQSTRWKHDYPFAGFVIKIKDDQDDSQVIGYQVIGNAYSDATKDFIPHTAETSYVIGIKFQNHSASQNNTIGHKNLEAIGSEAIGALTLFYGQDLFDNKAVVNQVFDSQTATFKRGTVFEKILATSRIDNPRSTSILENYGFIQQGEPVVKGNFSRYTHIKDFANEAELFNKSSENEVKIFHESFENDIIGGISNNFNELAI